MEPCGTPQGRLAGGEEKSAHVDGEASVLEVGCEPVQGSAINTSLVVETVY